LYRVMVLRHILQRLLNDPRVIDNLADSYPIRRAAKATARVIQQAQLGFEEAAKSELARKAENIKKNVTKEVEEGLKGIRKP